MDKNLKKISKGSLSFGLLFGEIHGGRKVVDEGAVDVEHEGFAEASDENVTEFFILVPGTNAIR